MPKARDFSEFMKELKGGFFVDELAIAVQDIVSAIEENGGGGKLTISLDFKKKSGHNVISVKPDFKAKKPEKELLPTLYFVTPDNNLQRENPRQTSMEFPVVRHSPSQTITPEMEEEYANV